MYRNIIQSIGIKHKIQKILEDKLFEKYLIMICNFSMKLKTENNKNLQTQKLLEFNENLTRDYLYLVK